MSDRLAREAHLLGPASMPGRLYDLGKWPGLRPTREPGLLVHGELYRLSHPATALPWLDSYEGIGPGVENPEYCRRIAEAQLGSGFAIATWVYVYQWSITGARQIHEGRWLDRHRTNPVPPSMSLEPAVLVQSTGSHFSSEAQAA